MSNNAYIGRGLRPKNPWKTPTVRDKLEDALWSHYCYEPARAKRLLEEVASTLRYPKRKEEDESDHT